MRRCGKSKRGNGWQKDHKRDTTPLSKDILRFVFFGTASTLSVAVLSEGNNNNIPRLPKVRHLEHMATDPPYPHRRWLMHPLALLAHLPPPHHHATEPPGATGNSFNTTVSNQVAGSSVVHLQAADFWNNNLTRGGSAFTARWVRRSDEGSFEEYSAAKISTDGVEEGTFWGNYGSGERVDTASTAAGYFFPPLAIANKVNSESSDISSVYDDAGGRYNGIGGGTYSNSSSSGSSSGTLSNSGAFGDGDDDDGDAGHTTDSFAASSSYTSSGDAYVSDVGGGRYEVVATTTCGFYWLEVGVVEAGGLWGTFYEDGGVETEGERERVDGSGFD